jgi:divalent metal cation (Fe/Co/Zn/Cd) transporter
MRVSMPELAVWSFLMATAHGAGLMLFPVLLGLPVEGATDHHPFGLHLGHSLVASGAAVLLHTLSMLVVMGLVALLVYERLGVVILRRAWLNFDALWALSVVLAGLFTLFT